MYLKSKKNRRPFLLVILVSLLLSAIICNYKGDDWEEDVRSVLYKIKNDSIPDYAKETIDERGIPYVYYREQNGITAGNQYNATIVCNYALKYYNDYSQTGDAATRRKFFSCVDWLTTNITNRTSYSLYEFEWQQPWYPSVGSPYTSGMTSGRAIEVFINADHLNPAGNYLAYADNLLRGFYVPIDSGGFTYKGPHGWWYEEIADTLKKTPRILDGHIFSILGTYQYWLETKSDSAKYIIQKGLQSLKHYLPSYNAGDGMIYYDARKKVADTKYHRIITSQLKQLYELTKDPIYLEYYERWNAPLAQPYVYRTIKDRNISGIILWLLLAAGTAIVTMGISSLSLKKRH